MSDSSPRTEMARLCDEVLHTADDADAALSRLTARLAACTAERDRLVKRLEDVPSSTTWRVGRVVVAPATLVRKRRRR